MNETLIKAVRQILSALIKILLRHGMAYGDFDKITRQCFVDVAFRDFSIKGKKQTASNVSILTGLNRKEVKKLLEQDDQSKRQIASNYNRCVRVIGGWLNDKDYLNEQGEPNDLALEGLNSFTSLVKKYSGDMPVVAMEKALINSGNICTDHKRIRLLNHAYLPSSNSNENIAILGTDSSELIKTIDHNLQAKTTELMFQRKASNAFVSVDDIPKIQQLLQKKGQAFLEEIDWFLSQHENKDESEKQAIVSVSMFYHDNQRDKEV